MVIDVVKNVGFYLVVMMMQGKVKFGDNLYIFKWFYILCMDLILIMVECIVNESGQLVVFVFVVMEFDQLFYCVI